MFVFAVIFAKISGFLLRLLGHGSDLPGRLALKIYPRLLSRFQVSGRIIAVTGSNGKTGTAGMIAGALRACGKSVQTNPIGSNMTGGIATVMCRAAKLSGKIDCDYLVLETDERYSRLIFADFKPDIMLVTNLFRDQITRNNNVDFIYSILDNVITPEVTLVANACDPISCRVGSTQKRVYFGCTAPQLLAGETGVFTQDCKVCPVCKHRLGYEKYIYNHIGVFRCEHCGFENPRADFVLESVDFAAKTAVINGNAVSCDSATAYGFMNLTAAAAVCVTAGEQPQAVYAALSSLKTNKTRLREFEINGRKGIMILSKNQNPVSFDLSISEVLRMEGKKTVVAYINNINHTDHRDTTWLWDIAFERLAGRAQMVCAGPRAYDLAVRLKYAGFADCDVKIARKNSEVKAAVEATEGRLCVLTELYDAATIMEAIK